ncbi:Ubiquitin carboxyl-terminal hydrolase 40 [Tupaia chinensis]|uniref:Ubiquitin carboxyl-terminal hydrolase 40 n=1 Tax=Tupaia chinensis TaxID=246437 RepID=L8XZX6_TUPCH|nr:Ubiquitin carboxyl-terminal hydrolase 40 [Tupaia chinensis]
MDNTGVLEGCHPVQVRIIPLQLQRLFAQLLLLDQEAATTTDLTDSFGWTSDEFLQLHSQVFLLSSDESTVSLLKNPPLQAKADFHRNDRHIFQMRPSKPLGSDDSTSCPHWFDINDSRVQPIKEKDIEKQFQGKESAYMLFYRKSRLQRPPEGDELTLCEIEIADGEDIFVWNGVEVGGVQIQTGVDCEPLLLNVLHLETGTAGEKCQQLTESPHVFPSNAELGTVFTALAIPAGTIFISDAEPTGQEGWTAVPREDLKKTFRQQGLRDGSSLLVRDAAADESSLLPKQEKWINRMNEIDCLEVKNLCQLDSEEEQVKIPATANTGFLKVPIWWYQLQDPAGHWASHQDQTTCTPAGRLCRAAPSQGAPGGGPPGEPLLYLGDVEIADVASLADLKSQAMTLPSLSEFGAPSPAFLRAWTVENTRLGRLLRADRQQLSPQDILLRTQVRIPGERAYGPATDLVWDTARGWTASSLRQKVADLCSLPVEKIEIAKYFPEKFEWLPISSWNQQITKRKKKKQQDNLQGAPYYLKDGDIIGIKNLLVDEDDDFSTVRDDIGKENQKQRAVGRKKRAKVLKRQPSPRDASAGT